eukprot:TRINITY_DN8479_c0_g1_i1.p1 TRINITY_DN8479_c0_g1~~TRINITY_DN8479_c0_g1_i1.p1  ORF type:complete len:340 (-),score=65.14 TRINITY_DN8479_c0_g1_i1:40-963(-)
MDWCKRPDTMYRLAIGSFVQDTNRVEIVQVVNEEIQRTCSFEHPYPPTKILWSPDVQKDMLATTGDYLRLWNINEDGSVEQTVLLPNNKTELCAPLTSFDWNDVNPEIIGTASIDTTCTIWDIERKEPKAQLIAHDKEVYDIAFAPQQTEVFASVGADGSVRMFDLRNLDHSTIQYETPDHLTPLLRIAWNKSDTNLLATIKKDSKMPIILDIRIPSYPLFELEGHLACVNALDWAPHYGYANNTQLLCTAADDQQALIWEMDKTSRANGAKLTYTASAPINYVRWYKVDPSWIGITFGSKLQILRM